MATIPVGYRTQTNDFYFYTAETEEGMDSRGLNCTGINTVMAEAIRTLTSSGEEFQAHIESNPYS